MRIAFEPILWAGSEHSFYDAQRLLAKAGDRAFGSGSGSEADPADEVPVRDGVAIISVSGPLIPSGNVWTRMFGLTDYETLRSQLIRASNDPAVGAVMLNVNSPGGAVSGLSDVASLVSLINKKVKPVSAYTAGTMASAALWLSAGARTIHAGSTALVGSLGVLRLHADQSKMLEEEGVKVTVLRSGRFKALMNPYEPLSDTARDLAQSQLDHTYAIFLDHVADGRGLTSAVADARFGQGREFIGEQAVQAGLIDGVLSFEDAFSLAAQSAQKARKPASPTNRGIPMKVKTESTPDLATQLTEQEAALLASGADIELPQETADDTQQAATEDEPAAETEEQAEPAVEGTKPADPSRELVAHLEARLEKAEDALVAARVETAQLRERAESSAALLASLTEIAQAATRKLHIALGGSGAHVEALSADSLVAEYRKTLSVFEERMKVGGISRPATNAPKQTGEESDPARVQKLRAVKF